MPTSYVFSSTVASVSERTRKEYVFGSGKEAVFRDEPLGWFVALEGSHEALWVGTERPDLRPGDRVKISIQAAA